MEDAHVDRRVKRCRYQAALMGTVGGRSTDLGLENGDQADPSVLEELYIHCSLGLRALRA